jgi:hypothetical protein
MADMHTQPLSAVLACSPGAHMTAVWGQNSVAAPMTMGITCSDGASHGPVGWQAPADAAEAVGIPSQFHFTCPASPSDAADATTPMQLRPRGGGFNAIMAWDDHRLDANFPSTPDRSVSGVRFHCATVDPDSYAGWTYPCVGTGRRCDVLGVPEDTEGISHTDPLTLPGHQRCPPGQLLAGLVLQVGPSEAFAADAVITHLRPLCTNSSAAAGSASSSSSSSTASSRVLGLQAAAPQPAQGAAPGQPAVELMCGPGQWVVGLQGAAGQLINQLGVTCSDGRAASTARQDIPAPPLPGGSTAFEHACRSGYDAVSVEDARSWAAPPVQLSARCAGTRLFSAPAGRAAYRDQLPTTHHCAAGSRLTGFRAWLGTWASPALPPQQQAAEIVIALQAVCGAVAVPRSAYPQLSPATVAQPPGPLPGAMQSARQLQLCLHAGAAQNPCR